MKDYNPKKKTQEDSNYEEKYREQFIAANNDWRAGCIANRVVSPAISQANFN